MVKYSYSVESHSLSELLETAKNLLLKNGIETKSQRGLTYSLNNVFLTWINPLNDKTRYVFWDKKSDEWYQDNFVKKNTKNLPENISNEKSLLIPYRYAQRARYYDSGWGYGLAVVKASKLVSKSLEKSLKDKQSFVSWLTAVSEYVHLQTILEILMWWGNDYKFWFTNQHKIENMLKITRIDTLDKITREVKQNPLTRRAITPSFMYHLDYLLNPMMGVPPYQNFQLLPSEKNEPLSSLHWHRSLDASGGAQLDFNHDFDWLTYAVGKTKRKTGNISILAGNLHLYASSESEVKRHVNPNADIKLWLNKVTDGYESGSGTVENLIQKPSYRNNINLVYKQLTNKN